MLLANNPFSRDREPKEVADRVHLLGTHRVNFYVVEDGKGITLVDCGFQGHRRYLDRWLRRHGRTTADIEAIVLTHGHQDHVGFAEQLRRRGTPVYMHPADDHLVRGLTIMIPPQRLLRSLWRPSAMSLLLEAAGDGVFTQPDLGAYVPIVRGQTLDVPGRPYVVPIPGHSPGSVSFHLADRGLLFTGDALMTRDPFFLGEDRAIVFADHTDRDDTCLEALSALADFSDAALLPAHGDPWMDAGSVGRALQEAVIAV
jgi:glyoxylase-like metal-dependent hydrolase (beta-lactamase superfamily II)